ncbi:MAG: type II toxin-antitoxin system RelE/ParE family toxin [Phycisphaerales bacterium JB039]
MAPWALSPVAFGELLAILEYIEGESGLAAADSVLDDFEKAFDLLASSPRAGRIRTEAAGDNIRWWLVHRYVVLYDSTTEPLRIIRILHGARDLDSLLRPQ